MDVWKNDFLDLVEEAHLTSRASSMVKLPSALLKGFLDVGYGTRDVGPARSYHGKATTRMTQFAVADGL
jgi:hypothetical protein